MPRTTLDIDATVLRELKRVQRENGKSLGELVSELLALALAGEPKKRPVRPFEWTAQPMRARIDLEDDEALEAALRLG